MKPTIYATLIYILNKEKSSVLLAKKTRKVGIGYWFGYGGKIESEQTADDCICQETKDESGGLIDKNLGITLEKNNLERVALIDFYRGTEQFLGNPNFRVLCYRTSSWEGSAVSTDEMDNPTWFTIQNIPWKTGEMKPGDELFVPQILAGTLIKGWIRFSEDEKTVLSHHIESCTIEDLII